MNRAVTKNSRSSPSGARSTRITDASSPDVLVTRDTASERVRPNRSASSSASPKVPAVIAANPRKPCHETRVCSPA
jgi:hypothetical protein